MKQDNTRYISGEWYENEYRAGWYKQQYIDTPMDTWAQDCNRYCIDLMIAYTGLDREAKVLDLGSGAGHIVSTWKSRGFWRVHGIEISRTAVLASHNPNIQCGSVANMPMYDDKEFDLVCSVALMEHIAPEQEHEAVKEIIRVGHRQAHFIAKNEGSDPGHINIKTMAEWADLFGMYFDGMVTVIPNALNDDPMLLCVPEKQMIHPLRGVKWGIEAKIRGEITL